ncbi:endo alpha-1,4 polygalactosaminidase [Brachybacterium sp. ACRRE]|uniref:endo alpha-1,4 polygalactosaminidase n=1 Tax=Brachybacterium sp. ACRRE TaxID=2918184 RepID=UPI001EF39813|nr:endo alpha-1,4 polygalactosaminidase [Brachybacterium sp. ACRRE]MCG7308852.1 endo alpha-1,4 polygalactosaminidase [Brachybacterium sp. ACRRE]
MGRGTATAALVLLMATDCGGQDAEADGRSTSSESTSSASATSAEGAAAAPSGRPSSDGAATPEPPPTSGAFDYQLGGAYMPSAPIDVVVRDATAEPLKGAYSVCYVNGFQTQPGDAAMWRDHADLLLHDAHGDLVTDPDWDDEYILDPSTAAQREDILEILSPVITGCAEAGYDAVEIDNLDTFDRFDRIDEHGAMVLAGSYVDLAHESGLAIAQKNAAEITATAHEGLGFDFAVAEECGTYDECAAYTSVYGAHVLQIEYSDSLEDAGMTFADVCALPDRAPLTILRDRDLVAQGVAGYRFESC